MTVSQIVGSFSKRIGASTRPAHYRIKVDGRDVSREAALRDVREVESFAAVPYKDGSVAIDVFTR